MSRLMPCMERKVEVEEGSALNLRTYYTDSSDEEDLRADQLLLRDTWRNLFDQFDPEGFGEIPWADFFLVLCRPEFKEHVSDENIDKLLELAYKDSGRTSAITFQQFINVLSGKRTQSFKYAVHSRDREVEGEGDFHIAKEKPFFRSMSSILSREVLTDPRDRKYYSSSYRCWPPPVFILSVSVLELAIFIFYAVTRGGGGRIRFPELGDYSLSNTSIDSVIVYCPNRSSEIWRYFSYFLVHSSWWHLTFNLVLQLLLGLPLEMVHGGRGCPASTSAGSWRAHSPQAFWMTRPVWSELQEACTPWSLRTWRTWSSTFPPWSTESTESLVLSPSPRLSCPLCRTYLEVLPVFQ